MKLLIQIGKRLTKQFDPSPLFPDRVTTTTTTTTTATTVDKVTSPTTSNTTTRTSKNDDSFYSLINIELKTETFNSPIPVKNFPC